MINGRKWWTSGAADERCQIFIVMGKTDPDGAPHRQQSMVLVPRDTPGLEIIRHLPVFGYQDQHGHSELRFTDVRVPATNILAGEGDGFMIAQARLGPGRIHHCMRAIGMAERALALMVERAKARVAFGRPLAEQGTVREAIALSRIEIDQARLYVLKTADLIDKFGAKGARTEISAIKVAAPKVALDVIDRAIQVHGGAGVSDDTPLASFYAHARTLRIVDGPDAVHIRGRRQGGAGAGAPLQRLTAGRRQGAIAAADPPAASFAMQLGAVQPDRRERVAVPVGVDLVGQPGLDLVRGVVVALVRSMLHELLLVELHRLLRPRRRRRPVRSLRRRLATAADGTRRSRWHGRRREAPGRSGPRDRRSRKPPTPASTTARTSWPMPTTGLAAAEPASPTTRAARRRRRGRAGRPAARGGRRGSRAGSGADMAPTLPAGQSRWTSRISSRSSPGATRIAPGTRPTSV